MGCLNQLELGEKMLRKSSEADTPAKEGPHSAGVWTLKTQRYRIPMDYFKSCVEIQSVPSLSKRWMLHILTYLNCIRLNLPTCGNASERRKKKISYYS